MASFLVIYGTGEGQTQKVAESIASALAERGHYAEAVDAEEWPDDRSAADFDAVIVGASIHAGKHQSAVTEFVERERDGLSASPSAFFQLSLSSAAGDDGGREKAAGYVDAFLEETDWHPDRIGLFGGALRYSKYGFLKRLLIKQIARRSGMDADTSRDYEYTDWGEVDAFASDFAAFVEGRLGIVPPTVDGYEDRE